MTSSELSRGWPLVTYVIERFLGGFTVVAFVGFGLLLTAETSQDTGILIEVLVAGGVFFGLGIFAAFCLAGPVASRVLVRFPGVSAQMAMVQQGFGILRTSRTLEIAAATPFIYVPDALPL